MFRPRHRSALLVALASASLALAACAPEPARSPSSTQYAEDARLLYEKAMAAFRDKDWEEARALFVELKKKYAYSRYARLAELRIADSDFEAEKVGESITAYRSFVSEHRSDDEVPYARWRICRALFSQINDTVLLPPAEERDQAGTAEAYKELRSFARDYPKGKYAADVAWMLTVVTSRLVRHELYVARYYLKQDDFEPAVARIQYALRTFDGSGMEPEAMVLLGETYLKMQKKPEARQVFELALAKYPASAFAPTAKNFLALIDRDAKK